MSAREDRFFLNQYYRQLRSNYPAIGRKILLRHRNRVQSLQTILYLRNYIKSKISCLDCGRPLKWMRAENFDGFFFKCSNCRRSRKFLHFDPTASNNKLKILLGSENIQLVSSALYLVLCNIRYITTFSQEMPEDPVDILYEYYQQSPNGFKFGGGGSTIVLADLYIISCCPFYAVLIVSDTEMVPTRYYLHAIYIMPNREGDVDEFMCDRLSNELATVENMVIKTGSILVLGRRLQKCIDAETYTKDKHTFKLIVPFDRLTVLDTPDKPLDLARNIKKIFKDAVLIIKSVNEVCALNFCPNTDGTIRKERFQQYLNSALWLRHFGNTPLKNVLYQCIKANLFLS